MERDPERGVFYEVRWEQGEEASAHYIVDEFADVFYMVVRHRDRQAAMELARQLENGLPVESLEALAGNFDVNVYPAGWAKAVLRLGVGAPRSLDEEFLMRFRESAGHRDASVRKATVWAMSYAGWPELRHELEEMARSETDPEVVDLIARTREVFAAEHG